MTVMQSSVDYLKGVASENYAAIYMGASAIAAAGFAMLHSTAPASEIDRAKFEQSRSHMERTVQILAFGALLLALGLMWSTDQIPGLESMTSSSPPLKVVHERSQGAAAPAAAKSAPPPIPTDSLAYVTNRHLNALNTRGGVRNTNGVAPARIEMSTQQQQTPFEHPSEFDSNYGARQQSDMRTHTKSGYAFNRLSARDATRDESGASYQMEQRSHDNITSNEARIAPQRTPASVGGSAADAAQIPVSVQAADGGGKKKVSFVADTSSGYPANNDAPDDDLSSAFAATSAGEEMSSAKVEELIRNAGQK